MHTVFVLITAPLQSKNQTEKGILFFFVLIGASLSEHHSSEVLYTVNFYADRKRGDRPCRKRGDQSEAFSFDDPASFFLSVHV